MADISEDELDQVSSAADVARIVDQMAADLEAHPAEWENHTLQEFLEALAAFLPYANYGDPGSNVPTWKLFAEALVVATGYE